MSRTPQDWRAIFKARFSGDELDDLFSWVAEDEWGLFDILGELAQEAQPGNFPPGDWFDKVVGRD